MSQAVSQETEPLLHPEQDHETSHITPYAASTAVVNMPDHANAGTEGTEAGPRTAMHKQKVDRLHHHREMVRDRFSANWWIEWIIILAVFSVTGSSTMLVEAILRKLTHQDVESIVAFMSLEQMCIKTA
ncbi:hypothetical protein EDD11_001559 [Mortierella claussenii]|nr:hypothetical protein EDD11_001559 [Mortierella claussenii]